MNEDRKDQLEDWSQDIGGATLEALMSLVPGVGPFLAVFANRTMGSSFERRTKQILTEMRDDLIRLEESGRATFTMDLAESDDFQAAMHRTIRRLLESGSTEKRKLLRNALLNRAAGFDGADGFERALDSCDATDVRVLVALEEETRWEGAHRRKYTSPRHSVPKAFERWGVPKPDLLVTRIALLVSLGLVDEDEKTEIKERRQPSFRRGPNGEPKVEQTIETRVSVTVSGFGERFLDFLKDPLEPEQTSPEPHPAS
ncbi:hypothetical protein [Curtobacterium sp. KBS0715]|uniref:hypothetical protein n=1 Tax=Curtobacterium sp. KBS0715 TaxID=1179671 RepID=UPI00110DDAE9|nr:hypothetical protein [Curtobacterium sp. KBS0715]TSD12600.1 hypothetical protein FFG40_014385 [Curtobacterium sp. KBS0715]